MAEINILASQVQRHDVSNNWININPILKNGEIGFETDTGKFKIGDGLKSWKLLNYSTDNATSFYDTNSNTSFQLWIGTQDEFSAIINKDPKIIYIIK